MPCVDGARGRATSRSGSTIWISPRLIVSTTSSLTSTPITCDAARGEHGGGRQADIAEAEDADARDSSCMIMVLLDDCRGCAAPPGRRHRGCARAPCARRRAASSSSRHALRRRSWSASVPTRLDRAGVDASGRSVVSRITSTGLPSDGRFFLDAAGVGEDRGATAPSGRRRAGSPAARSGGRSARPPSSRSTGSRTFGFRWTGIDDLHVGAASASSRERVGRCARSRRRSSRAGGR